MRTHWLVIFVVLLAVAGTASCENDRPPEPPGRVEKGLLDPRGPDLSVDAERLRASVRVVTNARVQQAEVDEGCARATTGRTLVRFDVVTPNHGPADLRFGSVECRSTDPSPACAGVDCFDNPSCCCAGRSQCTTSGGPFGGAFEFACPHRHIHFKSFASYRLLTTSGEVAASGHKQSFCLMDIEGIGGGACQAPSRFTCGNQGIHAGCADVYSSALPCSYVDATGVPEGDYILEVAIDPLDAINESNESNNTATAHVRIGTPPPPPPPPSRQLFLVRDGVGNEVEAATYYSSLLPSGYVPGVFTLREWKAEAFGNAPVVSAFYRNTNELGFWRQMTCSASIGRGFGGCAVTNWADVSDPDNGLPNRGTVAMRLDRDGRTQFFVFTPDGLLSPVAVLDSEGAKSVPRLCTNCHGGEYRGSGSDPDLGSIFREFEPSLLQKHPAVSDAKAEADWFALNQVIRQANQAVRSQAEGGPFGVDAAKAAMEAYMSEMYAQTDPPVSRSVADPAHLPPSWQTGVTAREREVKADLWTKVVNPYCMSCHRTSVFNYNSYSTFSSLSGIVDGRALLRRYFEVDASDPDRARFSFMPQSKLQWENLSSDAEALIAVGAWLGETNNRPPIANAGPSSRTLAAGTQATLSAAASSDPDGDPMTFRWEQVSGPQVTFSPSAAARDVSFTAPNVTETTDVVVRLRVTDSRLADAETFITFAVTPGTEPRLVFTSADTPIAIPDNAPAGISSEIQVGDGRPVQEMKVTVNIDHTWRGDLTVTLNGPGGFSKTLHQREGRDADNLHETFSILEAAGQSAAGTWTLHVSDNAAIDLGTLQSWSIELGVGDGPANRPPVADAGLDRTVPAGTTVFLTASGSFDPDRDPLDYLWESIGTHDLVFSPAPTERSISFVAPQVAEITQMPIRLRVRDNHLGEAEAFVTVTVTPLEQARLVIPATDLPLAIPDAEPTGVTSSITVSADRPITHLRVPVELTHSYVGDLILTLTGPNGFTKVLHNRANGSADDIRQTFEVFDLVGRQTAGSWQLHVSDHASIDTGTLVAWSLDFDVADIPRENRAPIANAGAGQTVIAGESVTLSAIGSSDPDGDTISYQWTQTAGPTVALSGADRAEAGFTAPGAPGTLRFSLTVSDTQGASAGATVTVTVTELPRQGRVLLAEVMVNPASFDYDREWVKIYNGTNAAVDLSNYSIGFGGNTTWGDTANSNGGVVQLGGVLEPGKCLLVGGPLSEDANASPNFAPAATYGLGLPLDFPGNGLQNPSTSGPDAVALFNLPAAAVGASAVPVDIVVYQRGTSESMVSAFIGPGATPAVVDVVAGSDAASGRSFRRVSESTWRVTDGPGGAAGPTPNTCTAISP